MEIRKAGLDDIKGVVRFIDLNFTREGYGFVTSAQIETEIRRNAVWVVMDRDGNIVGSRIGINKVYNLAVVKKMRGQGIGRALIEIHDPDTIRVKALPVGNLSKEQKENFTSPEGFYQKLGFIFERLDFARNFWQRGKDKAHFHKKGKIKHIKVYRNKNPRQQLLNLKRKGNG